MTTPAHVPLVVATRGDAVENVHYGSIAVVDRSGRLLWSAGDPRALTFTRSTLKAFQALPLMRDDGPRQFGFDEREVATMTSSHSGEPFHIAAVEGLLKKARNHWRRLKCGCHVPYMYETLGRTPPMHESFDARWHNCSGKHAGFLAWCQLHGEPFETYLEPDHPLQRRVRAEVGGLLGLDPDAIPGGVDGCSAPNLALPLDGLARLWAMLAGGGADEATDALLDRLFSAMTAHPEYVSGTGRSDLNFVRAGGGDWVAKVGAAGVQVLGVRSRGLGIAIKIADGHSEARFVAAFAVLRALGLTEPDDAELSRYAKIGQLNAAGLPTGELRPVFELAAH
ncbi:MAG: asparaginase [Burkholderiales bacterium]|nr:MAG: asparaginase [Burkholderiales bacterium]